MPLITTPYGAVHYTETGSGAPLLLLHANPGSSLDYESIMPELAKHYRVIGLDFPAYGQSPALKNPRAASAMLFAELVEAVVKQLDLYALTVIGNSVGGYCAVQLALQQPERVQALVLVSSGGFTPPSLISQLFCAVKGREQVTRLIATRFAQSYLKRRNPFVDAIIARTEAGRHDAAVVATDAAVWRSFTHPDHDLRAAAHAVTAPTLIINGRYDPVIRAATDGVSTARALPHAQQVILETGHAPFAEAPELFLATITPFLEQVNAHAPHLASAG